MKYMLGLACEPPGKWPRPTAGLECISNIILDRVRKHIRFIRLDHIMRFLKKLIN